MSRLEMCRLAYGSTLMDGGYTLWQDGKKRRRGFVVGGVEHESVCDKHDFDYFGKLYEDYSDIIRTSIHYFDRVIGIGTWRSDGQIYFDVVEHCENEDAAYSKCVMRGELAYYDIEKEKSVYIEKTDKT